VFSERITRRIPTAKNQQVEGLVCLGFLERLSGGFGKTAPETGSSIVRPCRNAPRKNRTSALGGAFSKLNRHAFRKALFESCGQPLLQSRFLLGRKS
jgi:hypothetical protein